MDLAEKFRNHGNQFPIKNSAEWIDFASLYLVEAAEEIERLRERLEIDPSHPYDGIYCRDETIRQQDAEIGRLRELAKAVCYYDWSDNDEDAVMSIANLRAAVEGKMTDIVDQCHKTWQCRSMEIELAEASAKLVEMHAEIERLKEKCDKQAMVIRRVYVEEFPDTWFAVHGYGETDQNNLPKYIEVVPAYGVDWSQVYERTNRTIGGMGS